MRTRRSPVVAPWGPAVRRSLLRRTALEVPTPSSLRTLISPLGKTSAHIVWTSALPPALALAFADALKALEETNG